MSMLANHGLTPREKQQAWTRMSTEYQKENNKEQQKQILRLITEVNQLKGALEIRRKRTMKDGNKIKKLLKQIEKMSYINLHDM